MKFAITIVSPPAFPHSAAFEEIAETIQFALIDLGHQVMRTRQATLPGFQHIILGANLLPYTTLSPPRDAILYNLEQAQEDSPWFTKAQLDVLRDRRVWDYSEYNTWNLTNLGVRVERIVPIGYVPELTRIEHLSETEKDIDVLFYGSMNPRRTAAIDAIRERGLNVISRFGLYGAERDALIARARLMLNVHFYDARVLEQVRITYLLANRCAVLSEYGAHAHENQAFAHGVSFAPYERLADTAYNLVNSPDWRAELAEHGLAVMRDRPERFYLETALA